LVNNQYQTNDKNAVKKELSSKDNTDSSDYSNTKQIKLRKKSPFMLSSKRNMILHSPLSRPN
jgi:hypothetical protein